MTAPEAPMPVPTDKTRLIVEAALDLKAERPVVIDMRSVSAFADVFVLLTGRSERHTRSVAEAIVDALEGGGERPLGIEGLDEGRWVLIDGNDVVVHLFDEDSRREFDLERLWSDAPRLSVVDDLGIEGYEEEPEILEDLEGEERYGA